MRNLGLCHEYGRGTEKNRKKAYDCYKLAANLGDHFGNFSKILSNLWLFFEKQLKESKKWKEVKLSYVGCRYPKLSLGI